MCNLYRKYSYSSSDSCLTNTDEQDISKIVPGFVPTKLAFESRFESGNLRKAIQVLMIACSLLLGSYRSTYFCPQLLKAYFVNVRDSTYVTYECFTEFS